jgi:hypothetical protein
VPISKLTQSASDSSEIIPCLPRIVAELHSFGGLTDYQASWLAEHWPDLPDDWPSHPLLRSTREHTRAYIDRESQRALAAATPTPPATKEPIPHA